MADKSQSLGEINTQDAWTQQHKQMSSVKTVLIINCYVCVLLDGESVALSINFIYSLLCIVHACVCVCFYVCVSMSVFVSVSVCSRRCI